jgi:hypothetical protein
MLEKITLIGEYLGNDPRGILVGGKLFIPKLVQETDINESTFENLLKAKENGWFDIKSHNYAQYLKERGIVDARFSPINADRVDGYNPDDIVVNVKSESPKPSLGGIDVLDGKQATEFMPPAVITEVKKTRKSKKAEIEQTPPKEE